MSWPAIRASLLVLAAAACAGCTTVQFVLNGGPSLSDADRFAQVVVAAAPAPSALPVRPMALPVAPQRVVIDGATY